MSIDAQRVALAKMDAHEMRRAGLGGSRLRSAHVQDLEFSLTVVNERRLSEYVRNEYQLSTRYSSSGESAIEVESIANYLIR